MSPSEDSLRQALRHGEGDGLDADFVVSRAESHRRARRARISGMVAAATVVAAVGVGSGFLLADDGDNPDRRAGADSVNSEYDSAGAGGGGALAPSDQNADYGSLATRSAPSLKAAAACPDTVPLVPYVAQKGQVFFRGPVATVLVCGYPNPTGQARQGLVLTGGDAQAVVRSLESPRTTVKPCPTASDDVEPVNVVIEAWYASGESALPVIAAVTSTCVGLVSNGAVSRVGWDYPPSVAKVIGQAIATAQPTSSGGSLPSSSTTR